MKRLREYFSMMITAVICFTMSLFHGRKGQAGAGEKVLAGGQAVSAGIANGCGAQDFAGQRMSINREAAKNHSWHKCVSLREKSPVCAQGPGDKRAGPAGTGFGVIS